MDDKDLTCKDCGNSFSWTAGEQKWYETKGFKPPKRCGPCRAAKKARESMQDDVVDRGYGGDGNEETYRQSGRGRGR